MRWTVVAVVVATAAAVSGSACSKPSPDDCEAIKRDPASGLALLTSKTDDAARVWDTLERCFAPAGDTCERAAVGGAMVPSMTVADGSSGSHAQREASWRQWAARCRTLPAEQQRCLQLSYAIGHSECAKLADEANAKLR
jgi:hypothetical protein